MDKEHYDTAATVFSPDGRVHQVEYSREAIKRGGLAMGIKYRDGILFTIDKSIFSPLVEEEDLDKFFKITPTIGSAASGLIADARVLIDIIREKAQLEKRRYGEEPDLRTLVDWISKIYEVYTRYDGVRPFGTAIIIGGYDPAGFHLYETDPSGVFQERKATAIGKGSRTAMEVLEKHYREGMSRDEAIALSFLILKETLMERPQDIPKGEEFHIISRKGFERIDLDEDIESVQKLIKEAEAAAYVMKKGGGPETSPDPEEFLKGIKGISDKTLGNITERFSTLEELKEASEEDLIKIENVGKVLARRIVEALKELDGSP